MDPITSAQAALDFKMRLGLRIAAEPEAFFTQAARSDKKQEDTLSPEGWLEACKSLLGNVDQTLYRSLYNKEMVVCVCVCVYREREIVS